MPLTADLDGRTLDATVLDDDGWAKVYRVNAPLVCRACRARMVAAVSSLGLRHFRHYRRPDECELRGETAEHLAVKRALLDAVRAVPGWTAEAEVPGAGWRADVLATGPHGRRVAWEVQVSRIAAEDAQERSQRLTGSGVEVCWLIVRPAAARGLARLPRVRLTLDDLQVIEHAERFDSGPQYAPERARWEAVTLGLATFVGAVCGGSVRWVQNRPGVATEPGLLGITSSRLVDT